MQGQRKARSLFDSIVNLVIGFAVAIAAQMLIFPLFGVFVSTADHIVIGLLFAVVSVERSYYPRRLFNWIRIKTKR